MAASESTLPQPCTFCCQSVATPLKTEVVDEYKSNVKMHA